MVGDIWGVTLEVGICLPDIIHTQTHTNTHTWGGCNFIPDLPPSWMSSQSWRLLNRCSFIPPPPRWELELTILTVEFVLLCSNIKGEPSLDCLVLELFWPQFMHSSKNMNLVVLLLTSPQIGGGNRVMIQAALAFFLLTPITEKRFLFQECRTYYYTRILKKVVT